MNTIISDFFCSRQIIPITCNVDHMF